MSIAFYAVILVLVVGYIINMALKDPCFMSYSLLYTGYFEELKASWPSCVKVDTTIYYHHNAIPEIDYKDYTFEKLRIATNGFSTPAVVRGKHSNRFLFNCSHLSYYERNVQ